MNDDPATPALRHWQEIDRRLNLGEFSGGEVAREVKRSGLVRHLIGPGAAFALQEIWVFEPERGPNLIPGPVLLVSFRSGVYGSPRLYRPMSDELGWEPDLYS